MNLIRIKMNSKIYISLLAGIAISIITISGALAQTIPGFTQEDVVKVAGITTDAGLYALTVTGRQTTRVFSDGIGRPVQTVAAQASPLQRDLIQPMAYNTTGNQTKFYLPYAGKSTDAIGDFRPNAISTDQPAFYNNATQHIVTVDLAPYSQQVFENSPLRRVLQAGMDGTGFQPGVAGNHSKSVFYRFNSAALDGNILDWDANGTFTAGNYFTDTTLSVTDATDEDGKEMRSFTDATGRLLLKRQLLAGANIDTYYIYNNAGMIANIIPPKALGIMVAGSNYSLTQTGVNKLIFSFVYDGRGRIIEKTVPAKGTMYIVYDLFNRPVLTQDANMLAANQWQYFKYDIKGRVISQGLYTDATHLGRVSMQAYANTQSLTNWYESRTTVSSFNYYTNTVFPTTVNALTFNYYDDYNFDNAGSPNYTYISQGLAGEAGATTAAVKGMPTISLQKPIGAGAGSVTYLAKVVFYDKRGNTIQIQSNNQLYFLGGFSVTDVSTIVPDFSGVPQVTKVSKQTAAATTNTVQSTFTYDHMYRVKTIAQAYNGGTSSVVAAYTYNELGQVIKKGLGFVSGTTYLQNVDMRYNIRGQLLSINNSTLGSDAGVTNSDTNDLFGLTINYDQADANLTNAAVYNGHISAVKWRSKDGSGTATPERAFRYYYDGLNRYYNGLYSERATAGTGVFTYNAGFNESITYDAGGNIAALMRNACTIGGATPIQIDNLNYAYDTANPNQLHTVTDVNDANHIGAGFRNLTGSTGSYTYDVNGNLTADPYKGLTLAYNALNRTDKITVTTSVNRFINYTYNTSGSLIRKQQYDNNVLQNTTDYIDGFVYVNSTLSYFGMPEGRVLNVGGVLKREFVITDQQGNARVSFQDNGSGVAVVKQENSYYAFGLIMPNSPVATPTTPNKQLYNGGSEWQNDYSNLPDYSQTFYRNYDAAVGRFIGVDPMAESSASMTPYQYAGNDPVTNNDPMGNLFKFPPPEYHATNYNQFVSDPRERQQMAASFAELSPETATGGGLGGNGDSGSNSGYAAAWIPILQQSGLNFSRLIGQLQFQAVDQGSIYTLNNALATAGVPGFSYINMLPEVKIKALRNGNYPSWWFKTLSPPDASQGSTPGWRPFVAAGVNPVIPGATFSYPLNSGAASESISGEAATGYILTRYGGTRPNSEYFSPRSTTMGQRYLLKGTNTEIYEEFQVLKPFGLEQTQIAGQDAVPTGGIQLRSSMPAGQLLNEGFIAPVETPAAPVEIPEFFMFP